MRVLGIDPGMSGYFVELDTVEKTARYSAMPIRPDDNLDSVVIAERFSLGSYDIIVIEDVGVNPIWGKKALFNFGYNVGQLQLIVSQFPHIAVKSSEWKRFLGLMVKKGEDPKGPSAELFTRLNPQHGFRKLNHNLVDAYMLAHFALVKAGITQGGWNFIEA